MMKCLPLVVLVLLFASCGPSAAPKVAPAAGLYAPAYIEMRSEQLAAFYEEYFEANLRLNPSFAQAIGDYRFNHLLEDDLSDVHRAKTKKLGDTYLVNVKGVDPAGLTDNDLLVRDFFIDMLERKREAESIPLHLLPVNQFYSRPNDFAVQGSGAGVHPFAAEKDYRDFIAKSAGFATWVDSSILRMREGMEKGIVLPKVLIERILPQLRAQFESGDVTKSTFYSPLGALPQAITGEARAKLIADYKAAITGTIMPAYKKLHAFMSEEYLAAGKAEPGLGSLPGGEAWYAYLIGFHTTTDMKASAIHEIGLKEVARIREEMDAIRKNVGFVGDLNAFFRHLTTEPKFFFSNKEELIATYQEHKKQIESTLPKLFAISPKTNYEIRPVEAFREKNAAGASYQAGTADGTRPGVFYINTYNLKAQPRWGTETLSLHEASPGHHFQISLQQEMQEAPKFQRFSENTAFAEGWALYAESIGKELGLFTDPHQDFGRLNDELLRAMRLVVDTGLHAKGWSREKAIDYMVSHSALAKSDITAEVERYMAIPGQALSYKIGQLKISELRRRAQSSLGAFDVRDFHAEVLRSGSLPLRILEAKIDRWIGANMPRNRTTEQHQ